VTYFMSSNMRNGVYKLN